MDRVSGWYKKQTNRILIIIGLCLAIAFNVNTIDIVRKLSVDKNVREAMVQNASDYVRNHVDSVHSVNNKIPPIVPGDTNKVQKTSAVQTDTNFTDIRAKLDSIKSLYKTNITEANTTMGLGWGDFGFTDDSLRWIKESSEANRPVHKHFFGKIFYVLGKTTGTPYYWLGFLITAFAISLGAPFWFDLLNKFVNLRVGGTKPEKKNNNSKTPGLNQMPDPTAKG